MLYGVTCSLSRETYRTFTSRATVFDVLTRLSKERDRSLFQLKGGEPRIGSTATGTSWLDIDVLFNTERSGLVGDGRGIASVVRCADGEWRIWMLRTWLECYHDHGHPDVLEPVPTTNGNGGVETHANGHTNGASNGVQASGTDYDAIIVGGGQAGLSTAGRLKALGVSYLLLERRPEIGNVWTTRYESLRWHTSKHVGSLPFGHTYPEEDDYMLPAKRIGAGHKAWSERYEINLQTSTDVEFASFDGKRWTVGVSSAEGKQTFTARHLVLSIGTGHLTPVVPNWATTEKIDASGYKGTIVHGSGYRSCAPWAGKHGIVVGTANTGHDVAEDMANAGMTATMIQRGSTFVFPAEWLHRAEDIHYRPDTDVAEADKASFTCTYGSECNPVNV